MRRARASTKPGVVHATHLTHAVLADRHADFIRPEFGPADKASSVSRFHTSGSRGEGSGIQPQFSRIWGKSFSLSVQGASKRSVSGARSSFTNTVNGRVYAFGSSIVTSISSLPKERPAKSFSNPRGVGQGTPRDIQRLIVAIAKGLHH